MIEHLARHPLPIRILDLERKKPRPAVEQQRAFLDAHPLPFSPGRLLDSGA